MTAIIQLFLAYLPILIKASESFPEIITFISNVHAIFQRKDVWTDAQEKEFDDSVAALKDDPYWKPDPNATS